MKRKLTTLFLFLGFIVMAQKQIQPFILKGNSKQKPEKLTLIIYASATNNFNVTFSLRNEENKLIKYKDSTDSFTVFPFTKVFFKSKLLKAIEDSATELNEKDKTDYKNLVDSEIDNIYQYFQALINAVFEYDTEPVAGVLKYSLKMTVNKKNIQGIDANDYFNRQAKVLRSIICDTTSKEKDNKKIKYQNIDNNPFMEYILKSNIYCEEFENYFKRVRFSKKHGARSKFKRYAKTRLPEIYNYWKLEKLLKTKIVSNYETFLTEKRNLDTQINNLKVKKEKLFDSHKKIDTILHNKKKDINKILNNINTIDVNLSAEVTKQIKLSEQLKNKDGKNKTKLRLELSEVEKTILKLNNKKIKLVKNLRDLKYEIKGLEDDLKIINNKVISYDSTQTKHKDSIKKKRYGINKLINKYKDELSNLPFFYFEANNVEMDINDGFIEHITVVGKITKPVVSESISWKNYTSEIHEDVNITLALLFKEDLVQKILNKTIDKNFKFVNVIPMGFSSKADYDDLYRYNLYHSEGKEKLYSLPITNVIQMYIQKHQNDRLNFSPKDQVVNLPSDDKNNSGSVELKKETSSKVLAAKIYSDFLGFEESNPNGLIQIEVEKQIPLWTKRFFLNAGRNSNLGYFNYANFNLTWSRIDQNKVEVLTAQPTNTDKNKVTFLELVQYDNVSLSTELNLLTLDLPLVKLRVETNLGAKYGRVSVRKDEQSNAEDLGFFTVKPDILVKIRPEERFGGLVRFSPMKVLFPPSTNIEASSYEDPDISTKNWLHQIEFSSFFTPSIESDNKFFFRYRYTNNSTWNVNGFGEFQVGYLMYLKF